MLRFADGGSEPKKIVSGAELVTQLGGNEAVVRALVRGFRETLRGGETGVRAGPKEHTRMPQRVQRNSGTLDTWLPN